MSEFGPQNPAPGGWWIFCADSEFEVRNAGFGQREAKNQENIPQKFRKLFFSIFFAAERLAQSVVD